MSELNVLRKVQTHICAKNFYFHNVIFAKISHFLKKMFVSCSFNGDSEIVHEYIYTY